MLKSAVYFLFGFCVIGAYFYVVSGGYVLSNARSEPKPPAAAMAAGGVRAARPSFWTTGYLGGK
jgi:hypothetical protein